MITYEIDACYFEDVLEYLYKNNQFLKVFCDNTVKDVGEFCIYNISKTKKTEPIPTLGLGSYLFTFNENNIFVTLKEEGVPVGTQFRIDYYKRLIISCQSEGILKDFLIQVFTIEKPTKKDLRVFITNEHGEWDIYHKIPSRSIGSVYVDTKIKEKVLSDIKDFLEKEEEYTKFGIPYKKTYLLTGPAGSGKTSLIKAICNEFGFSLSMLCITKGFDNTALTNSLRSLSENSVLLIEDIDSFFEKRDTTANNPLISFSNLINLLDGVLYRHATLIFLTTNHPEKLDQALIRIGRVDMILQINQPSKTQIESMFNDMMENKEVVNGFDKFYENIKGHKLPTSAIINFLFRYRENWLEYIDELLDTNAFIRNTLKQNVQENLYS